MQGILRINLLALFSFIELWTGTHSMRNIFALSSHKVEMPLGSGSRLTLSPNDRTVKKFVGETYVVSCVNGASDTQWFSPNGEKVADTKISRVRQQLRRGGGGIDLFLQRVTLEDAGLYTCRSKATNVTFNFVVIKPITFDNTYAHQTAQEFSTFTIKCVASGQSTTPKLYWKVNGKSPQGPKFKVVKDGLMVQNVTKEDAKRSFVCHAMDIDSPMPDVKSMNIMLHVARKPAQVQDKETVSEKWGAVGEWANFTCKIESDPIPTFEWFGPSSERLTFNDDTSIVNDIINSTHYTSSLQIRVTQESQFGPYVCRGGNDVGAVERTFTLRRSMKPSTPFLEVEKVTAQYAKIRVLKYKPLPGEESVYVINGNKSHELPVLDYQVETKLVQNGDFYPAKYEMDENGFTLTHLLPGTSYHVRAALKNALGIGHFSTPLQFATAGTQQISTTKVPVMMEEQKSSRKPKSSKPIQLPISTATSEPRPCPPSLFQCKSGECITYAGKCNGMAECKDSSDEEPEMCRVALATPYFPPVINTLFDSTEPTPAASRSVSSQAQAKSPLYMSPARRLFYVNGANSLSASIHKLGLQLPPKTLPTPPRLDIDSRQRQALLSSEEEDKSGSASVETSTEYEPAEADANSNGNGKSPQITTMNETTVQVRNGNKGQTKTTTNTVTTITKTENKKGNGKGKVVTTRKEIVITEKVEMNEL